MTLKLAACLDPVLRDFRRGIAVALIIRIAAAGSAFGLNLVLAWCLGASGAGQYYLALATMSLFAVVGRLGLDGTVLRFVARCNAINDWGTARRVFHNSIALVAIVSSVVCIIGWIEANELADSVFMKSAERSVIQWVMPAIIPFALLMIISHALQGVRSIALSIALPGIFLPLLSTVGVLLTTSWFGVVGAIWSFTISATICATFGLLYCLRKIPGRSGEIEKTTQKQIIDSASSLFIMSLIQPLISWLPIFALGIWGHSVDIGIFEAANRTALLISIVVVAINAVVAPRFAEMHRFGDLSGLESIAQESARLMLVFALPLSIICIFFPALIMSLYGSEYIAGAAILPLLAVGQLVNAASGSVMYLLMMSGNERDARNIISMTVGIGTVVTFVAVPVGGIVGAAFTTCLMISLQNLLALFYVHKRLGIWTVKLPRIMSNRHLGIDTAGKD